MNCLICHSPTHYFFSKDFNCFGLDSVDYERCSNCGTVFARTLLELSEDQWQLLCSRYHDSYRGSGENPDDPNWRSRLNRQGNVLLKLTDMGVLPKNRPWLDYGCGEGELAAFLARQGLRIDCYDRYWPKSTHIKGADLLPGRYPVVINTSLFEHLRSRSSMDSIANLVNPEGVLALHTLVRGEIPQDPCWFYLLPVHTLFFTNKAMALLFRNWGYQCSLYDVDARLWVWFRQPLRVLLERFPTLKDQLQWKVCDGFIAYWP
jgi:SAM-dependent methyltransferase